MVDGRDEPGKRVGLPSGGSPQIGAPASALKRAFLHGALDGKIAPKDFPAWYQDILGKPYTDLQEADVKPLLDAAWWIGRKV